MPLVVSNRDRRKSTMNPALLWVTMEFQRSFIFWGNGSLTSAFSLIGAINISEPTIWHWVCLLSFGILVLSAMPGPQQMISVCSQHEYQTRYLCWEDEAKINNYITVVRYTDCEPGVEQFTNDISLIIFASGAFQKLEKQIWWYFSSMVPIVQMKKLSYMQGK